MKNNNPKKKIYTSINGMFYNSKCLIIEYHDIIKSPWFTLLAGIHDNEIIGNTFVDLEEVRSLNFAELYEWYEMRKHRNFYYDLPYKENVDDETMDRMLYDQTNYVEDGHDIICEDAIELSFSNVVKLLPKTHKLVDSIVMFTDGLEPAIERDIQRTFGTDVIYKCGKISDIVKDLPEDSTYVFSDITKITELIECNRIERSSIILPTNYRYNMKVDDPCCCKIPLDELSKKYIFKVDTYDSYPLLENEN